MVGANPCDKHLQSRRTIDKIGSGLVTPELEAEMIEGFKCYRKFRLSSINRCIERVLGAGLPTRTLLSARLKRMVSVQRKLVRVQRAGSKNSLSRMYDIVGIRVVFCSFSDLLTFSGRLEAESSKVNNYVENPQDTGYRALHHILDIEQPLPSDKESSLKFQFEVQLRTHYQHQWGIWSESYGEQVKEGSGRKEIHAHLRFLSSTIEKWEVSNQQKIQVSFPERIGDLNFALVRKMEKMAPIYIFTNHFDEVLDHLFYWEEKYPDDHDSVLLAGEGNSDVLRNRLIQTHPTYFRNTNAPEKIISKDKLDFRWVD